MTPMIEYGEELPFKTTQIFTTDQDQQTTFTVSVFAGQRVLSKDNLLLGKFDLIGIPPAQKGEAQIEVTFEIDEDSILKVTGVVKDVIESGTISLTYDMKNLSSVEIEKMFEDAEKFEEKDREIKQPLNANY